MKINRYVRRPGVVALVCGMVVIGAATPAAAATVESTVGDLGTHSGRDYWNQATADNGPDEGYTATWVSGSNVPAGWIGSQPRLFTSAGAMCSARDMSYMPVPSIGWEAITSNDGCASGYVYSKGVSAAWDGDGYSLYSTFRTPNIFMS